MSIDVMGIINLSENEQKIQDLAINRPIAAIPFAGRYRIIDFSVSNMVNSGIQKIAIFTRDKFRSLQDHLGSGKYWSLDRKRDGLFMLHPMIDFTNAVKRYGDLQTFADNLEFIKNSRQEYVLIARSYMLTNINLAPALDFHKESGADVTIIGKPIENAQKELQYIGLDSLDVDENYKINGVGLNFGSKKKLMLSMEMYLLKRDLFVEIIQEAYEKGRVSFLKQAVFDYMDNLSVNVFPYMGPAMCINSISNYYKASIDLLDRNIFNAYFDGYGRIYTKIKDEPSTFYGKNSKVTHSIVANGCIIEGKVENSILFRGVHVKKDATIRNSIVMQETTIGSGALLSYVITDKEVMVSDRKLLMGDGGVPFVIKKRQVIK